MWDEFEMFVAILLWYNIQAREQMMLEISAGKYITHER